MGKTLLKVGYGLYKDCIESKKKRFLIVKKSVTKLSSEKKVTFDFFFVSKSPVLLNFILRTLYICESRAIKYIAKSRKNFNLNLILIPSLPLSRHPPSWTFFFTFFLIHSWHPPFIYNVRKSQTEILYCKSIKIFNTIILCAFLLLIFFLLTSLSHTWIYYVSYIHKCSFTLFELLKICYVLKVWRFGNAMFCNR